MDSGKPTLQQKFGYVWAASFGIIFAILGHLTIQASGLDASVPVRNYGWKIGIVVLLACGLIAAVSALGALLISALFHGLLVRLKAISGRSP